MNRYQDIEPNLQYCPLCGDEYRAEIETCASCAVALVRGEELLRMVEIKANEKGERGMEIAPGTPLVAVRQGPILQIKQLKAYLASHSLPSMVIAEGGGNCGKGCCATEVMLQVREADLPDVMAVLEQEYRSSTGLTEHDTTFAAEVYNPSADEATCPACGHIFSASLGECPDCGLCFG